MEVAELATLNEYSVKEVYTSFTLDGQSTSNHSWFKVWNKVIPLKVSCMMWRLLSNRIPTKDNLAKMEVLSLGQLECSGECGSEESVFHFFLVFGAPLVTGSASVQLFIMSDGSTWNNSEA